MAEQTPRTPTPSTLGGAALLTPTLSTVYTSTGAVSVVNKCTFTNVTNDPVRVMEVHFVPSGGTASNATLVLTHLSIGPFATYVCDEVVDHVLNAGDFVQAWAEVDQCVTMRMSGQIGV